MQTQTLPNIFSGRTLVRPLKILDFDIENRPISYAGNDFTFADVTAIAASFHGSDDVKVWVKGDNCDPLEMLLGFKAMYDEADIVTGHYIRKHDLPHINAAFMDFRIPPLTPKMTQCTKEELRRSKGLSLSQESLCDMYGFTEAQKYHMTQHMWKLANRGEPAGLKFVRERVVSDIRQHILLYNKVLELNWMKPGKYWKP